MPVRKRVLICISILIASCILIVALYLAVDPMNRVRLYTKLGGDYEWAFWNLLPTSYLEERFSGQHPTILGLQLGSGESVLPGDWFYFVDADPLTFAVKRHGSSEYEILAPVDGDTYLVESHHMPFRLAYRVVEIVDNQHGAVALLERSLKRIVSN